MFFARISRASEMRRTLRDHQGVRAAFRAERLEMCGRGAEGLEGGGDFGEIDRSQEVLVDSGAELVVDPGGEKEAEGFSGRFERMLSLGDPVVALVKRGFDIEPDPVHQRENIGEEIGKNPGSVQADLESEILHRAHGARKAGLRGGFPPAEHHGFQKIFSLGEDRENRFPALSATIEGLEVRVVAIAASPHASLAKNHGREVSRIVHRGERDKASDLEGGVWGCHEKVSAQKRQKRPANHANLRERKRIPAGGDFPHFIRIHSLDSRAKSGSGTIPEFTGMHRMGRMPMPRKPMSGRALGGDALLEERGALAVLALFAGIELRDRAVVAHHSRPHLAPRALTVRDVCFFHKF